MGGRMAMSAEESWALLGRAPSVEVAAVIAGRPVLRTLHGWVWDGALWFHGGATGEKEALDGAAVRVGAHEVVARIPSWMRDPERACPATTFYRSVQVGGTLRVVDDPEVKAAALQAFMERFQPEGGHVPIAADHRLYRKAVAQIRVLRLDADEVSGVAKLGQDKTAVVAKRIVDGLWRRGDPGDLAGAQAIADAHPAGIAVVSAPPGLVARIAPTDADLEQAVGLVAGEYWNAGLWSAERLRTAHARSTAWVGLRAGDRLVATARAVSDVGKRAWVYDVGVDPAWRGQGVGAALMAVLLDHPAVRDADVLLATRDAMAFYAKLGFEVAAVDAAVPRTTMVRRRGHWSAVRGRLPAPSTRAAPG